MIKLALGLIHNKGNLGNRSQITNLLPLIVANTDPETGRRYYTLANVAIEHEVTFYQVIPFGINPPNNLYDLDSWKVFYGAGDENKTGEHCRFLNWLLKRGTDNGAQVAVYVRAPALFGAVDLDLRLRQLVNNVEFVEATWGKLATLRLLRVVGQLREDLDFDISVDDLKVRIIARGLGYG